MPERGRLIHTSAVMTSSERTRGLPTTVGVLSGGRMGAGIAHAFLTKDAKVILVERDEEAAQGARTRVESAVQASLERGAVTGSSERFLENFITSVDCADFALCDLVVEAVPEDRVLKATALADVEVQLPPHSYVATNTSSLSVSDLAASLTRPENFLGLHFFNPVPASSLIEVVIAEKTSEETVGAARRWVRALGKTAVVVKDTPGFCLIPARGRDRTRGDAHGRGGRREPRRHRQRDGPGLQAPRRAAQDDRHRGPGCAPGHRRVPAPDHRRPVRPPQILRDKVAAGALGRKSGQGFYDWA